MLVYQLSVKFWPMSWIYQFKSQHISQLSEYSAGLGAHYFRISTISCNEKKITENNTSFLSRQPQSIPGYQSNQASLSCLLFIGYLDLKIRRLNKTTATKTVNVNKIQKSHHSRLKFDKKGQKHTVFSHAAKFSSWY